MNLIINRMISKYNFNAGNISRIKYIVIHYVGGVAGAKQNCEYFSKADLGASAHFFVGHDGEIWQSVEIKNIAWHCGSKTGYKHPSCRNANSIGIELCCKTTGDPTKADANWYFTDATVQAAIELTKQLMDEYNIPAENVIRHYDVTGKTCPAPFVFNSGKHTWDQFKRAISSTTVSSTEQKQEEKPSEKTKTPFTVRISIPDLNIRKGPGTNYSKTGKYTGIGIFTIVEVQPGPGSTAGWGLLKSYATKRDGWISLDFDSGI